ncbi:hypothetical protein GCM10011351_30130 [Paraliobacillus quinghaiensis]|uniref:SCP domain-containing protein n=1 Tax=Paraliobacillus quinghaiensis TaxID=470815 RepID=A0A917WYL7_9BACI|nr:CAP domain-containing protein [Paraliobacillus quinghaiensis]GGM42029.1 hypothetical protein GCM10011351_30130 [Paraliobacillus quinghaiensis]
MKKKAYIVFAISILIASVLFVSGLLGQDTKEAANTYENHSPKHVDIKDITIDAENIVRFVEVREEEERLLEEQEQLRLEEERLEKERIKKEEELRLEEVRRKEQEQDRIEEEKRAEQEQSEIDEADKREDEKQSNQSDDNKVAEEESNQTTEENQAEINYQGISSFERDVVTYTNAERVKHGLPELKIDSKLSEVAWYKSKDMEVNSYFSHTSPRYGSPFEMMKDFGVSYTAAGENIAMGYPDAKSVVNGWMNSEGHRKNILNENYTHIGVGFVQNGHYATQMFMR